MIRSCCLNIIHQVFFLGKLAVFKHCPLVSRQVLFQDFVKMLGGKCSSKQSEISTGKISLAVLDQGGQLEQIAIYVVDKLFVQN